jgi:translation elongation factor P/translation initiation factor 5A
LEKQDSLSFIEYAETKVIKVFTNKRSQKSETSAPNTRLSKLQTVDIDKEQIMVLNLETCDNTTQKRSSMQTEMPKISHNKAVTSLQMYASSVHSAE